MGAEHRSAAARASTRPRITRPAAFEGRRARGYALRPRNVTTAAFTSAPPSGVVAGARQFARSVIAGLVVAGVITLAGPVLSYRADVATIREQLQLRVSREAQVYAQALRLYLELLQSDWERVVERPEWDRFDGSSAPEKVLLEATHRGSPLFGVGIAVLDRDGKPVWSEPPEVLKPGVSLRNHRWFQELLARGAPVF